MYDFDLSQNSIISIKFGVVVQLAAPGGQTLHQPFQRGQQLIQLAQQQFSKVTDRFALERAQQIDGGQ